MLPPEFEPGLARARTFTQGRQNPLVRAAEQFLDPQQRAFFELSYASMRFVDDLVDERFLALSPRERREERPFVLRALEDWLSQVETCAGVRAVSQAPDLEPELFGALGHFLRRSTLGVRPWQRLVRALRRDVYELPIETWPEYLEYCEGACVAPATVFVYLVGSEFAADGASHYVPAEAPERIARPLAIFAYLVHLLRDLNSDAARDPQLVHLPRAWFQAAEHDFPSSVRALAAGEALTEPVASLLFGHLESAHEKAQAGLERSQSLLQTPAHAALHFVVERYVEAWREMRAVPAQARTARG